MEELSKKLLNLKRTLECPVCLSLPESIPIFQCENGHIICKSCHLSLDTCPQCRKPLGHNRSLVAESFLEAFSKPCPFAKHGCEAKILPDLEETHKKSCAYRVVPCPVKFCSDIITIIHVKDHLQAEHAKQVIFADEPGHYTGKLNVKDVSKLGVRISPTFITLKGQNFIMMKIGSQTGLWHFWIYGVGQVEQMQNFNFELQFWTSDGSSRISCKEVVVSIDKLLHDVLSDGNGLILTSCVIKKLMNSGPINYEVTISEK